MSGHRRRCCCEPPEITCQTCDASCAALPSTYFEDTVTFPPPVYPQLECCLRYAKCYRVEIVAASWTSSDSDFRGMPCLVGICGIFEACYEPMSGQGTRPIAPGNPSCGLFESDAGVLKFRTNNTRIGRVRWTNSGVSEWCPLAQGDYLEADWFIELKNAVYRQCDASLPTIGDVRWRMSIKEPNVANSLFGFGFGEPTPCEAVPSSSPPGIKWQTNGQTYPGGLHPNQYMLDGGEIELWRDAGIAGWQDPLTFELTPLHDSSAAPELGYTVGACP